MNVGYITNADEASGVGHYAQSLRQALQKYSDLTVKEFQVTSTGALLENKSLFQFPPWPGILGNKSIGWVRAGKRLRNELHNFDLIHATNQTLSFLKPAKPFIVTIHDIIEVIQPQDKRAYLLNSYLYSGLKKANHIIAVSAFTKQQVQEQYGISEERITTIYNGVDPQEFFPIPHFSETVGYQTLRQDLKLDDNYPIVLYVGSDHPRKNLGVAIRAFAKLQKQRPDAVFIKVGAPGIASGRITTLELIDELGLRKSLKILQHVSQSKLNELYNMADVFIYPSRFEGFGLPPLQAMAAGLPVVCSNATSLPEIVKDAAITHDPDDLDAFADSLLKLTSDKTFAEVMRTKGLAQAATFSWDTTAAEVYKLYQNIL